MGARSALRRLAIGIALLACPGSSGAVAIEFDVSGASTERNHWLYTTDPLGFHETPFSAASSLTLETDANGDGTSGDYTVVDSHLVIQGSFRNPWSDYGFGETGLTWDLVGELRGGSGRLEDYFGIYEYISWRGPASYSVSGTWQCYGFLCDSMALPEGVPMPYAEMLAFMGMEPIEAVVLGSWTTDGLIPTVIQGVCYDFEPVGCHTLGDSAFRVTNSSDELNYPTAFITLSLEGQAVPEPATAWVVAGGFLALALRRCGSLRGRSSDTMRRHEVA